MKKPVGERERVRALLDMIDAQDRLLACHRTGRRPPETLFDQLVKGREAVEEARLHVNEAAPYAPPYGV